MNRETRAGKPGKASREVMDAMQSGVEGMTRQMSKTTLGSGLVPGPTNKGAKGKSAKTTQKTCRSGRPADGRESRDSPEANAEGLVGSK